LANDGGAIVPAANPTLVIAAIFKNRRRLSNNVLGVISEDFISKALVILISI
jgi:hypothetical protein